MSERQDHLLSLLISRGQHLNKTPTQKQDNIIIPYILVYVNSKLYYLLDLEALYRNAPLLLGPKRNTRLNPTAFLSRKQEINIVLQHPTPRYYRQICL